MAKERSEALRQKAYEIWEREGRPEGMHDDHWTRAEQELEQDRNEKPKASRARKTAPGAEETVGVVADVPVKKKAPSTDATTPAAQKPKRPARTRKP